MANGTYFDPHNWKGFAVIAAIAALVVLVILPVVDKLAGAEQVPV